MNLAVVTKSLTNAMHKNSPSILTALGVGGLLTSIVLAVKGTIKAVEAYEQEMIFRRTNVAYKGLDPLIEPKEVIELTWQFYIPTAVMGLTTAVCIIGANNINLRRNAALASLYSVTETAMREYQEKVIETVGEKKEEDIRAEIIQDKLDKNPVEEKSVIITGDGEYLCYDVYSGRYFRSNVQNLQRAEIEFNQQLMRDGWYSINEFYYLIGLDPIKNGDEIGWIAERNRLELKFTSKNAKNSEPCLVMDYYVSPRDI